jgi:hypothetical protein
LHTQTHWMPLIDAIYAVINGINEVRTMRSGVLLSVHLACTLLVHFASQVRTLSICNLCPFFVAAIASKLLYFVQSQQNLQVVVTILMKRGISSSGNLFINPSSKLQLTKDRGPFAQHFFFVERNELDR